MREKNIKPNEYIQYVMGQNTWRKFIEIGIK